MRAAAQQGHYATAYVFEETRQTYLDRMAGINMDLREYVDSGRVAIHQVDPAELSPGELASRLRDEVENKHARVVVIDSLSGYVNALPNEQFLLTQLHEMLNFLSEYGVLTILIAAQSGTIGPIQTTADVSYLADTLVLLRFFEHRGALKKAISVVKHRKSAHEDTIRELQITGEGVRIGSTSDANCRDARAFRCIGDCAQRRIDVARHLFDLDHSAGARFHRAGARRNA